MLPGIQDSLRGLLLLSLHFALGNQAIARRQFGAYFSVTFLPFGDRYVYFGFVIVVGTGIPTQNLDREKGKDAHVETNRWTFGFCQEV